MQTRTLKSIYHALGFAMILAVAITIGEGSALRALIVCAIGGVVAGTFYYLEHDAIEAAPGEDE